MCTQSPFGTSSVPVEASHCLNLNMVYFLQHSLYAWILVGSSTPSAAYYSEVFLRHRIKECWFAMNALQILTARAAIADLKKRRKKNSDKQVDSPAEEHECPNGFWMGFRGPTHKNYWVSKSGQLTTKKPKAWQVVLQYFNWPHWNVALEV